MRRRRTTQSPLDTRANRLAQERSRADEARQGERRRRRQARETLRRTLPLHRRTARRDRRDAGHRRCRRQHRTRDLHRRHRLRPGAAAGRRNRASAGPIPGARSSHKSRDRTKRKRNLVKTPNPTRPPVSVSEPSVAASIDAASDSEPQTQVIGRDHSRTRRTDSPPRCARSTTTSDASWAAPCDNPIPSIEATMMPT